MLLIQYFYFSGLIQRSILKWKQCFESWLCSLLQVKTTTLSGLMVGVSLNPRTLSESQSHVATDSQSVLVSNPLWGSRPDFSHTLDIYGLCRRVAPSLTRGRVRHLSGSQSVICTELFTFLTHDMHSRTLYKRLCQSRRCAAYDDVSYLAHVNKAV
jgi:hypothetical protein